MPPVSNKEKKKFFKYSHIYRALADIIANAVYSTERSYVDISRQIGWHYTRVSKVVRADYDDKEHWLHLGCFLLVALGPKVLRGAAFSMYETLDKFDPGFEDDYIMHIRASIFEYTRVIPVELADVRGMKEFAAKKYTDRKEFIRLERVILEEGL